MKLLTNRIIHLGGLCLVTSMLFGACTGSESADSAASEATATTVTALDPAPASEATAPESETTAIAEERRSFKGSLAGNPSYLAPMPYRTSQLVVPFDFDIPETEARVRWNGLYDLERQMVLLLTPPEPVPGPDPSAVPGLSVAVTDSSIDEATTAIEAASPNAAPLFTAEAGQLFGRDATVITGQLRQDIELASNGGWSFDLPHGTSMQSLQQPERDYLMYLVEVGDQIVIIEMNGHPEQFDLIVTEALRVIETMSFLQ